MKPPTPPEPMIRTCMVVLFLLAGLVGQLWLVGREESRFRTLSGAGSEPLLMESERRAG